MLLALEPVICLTASVYLAAQGIRSARLYLFAFSVVLITVVLFVLASFGVIVANQFTLNAWQLGVCLDIVLLSLALAGVVLLFAVAVTLHARLYDLRPPANRLTLFYLVMSAGGALGGLFTALVAPVVFDWAWEHPILVFAAAALLPLTALPDWRRLGPWWFWRAASWCSPWSM